MLYNKKTSCISRGLGMIPTGLEPATPTLSNTEYEYYTVIMNILVQLSLVK